MNVRVWVALSYGLYFSKDGVSIKPGAVQCAVFVQVRYDRCDLHSESLPRGSQNHYTNGHVLPAAYAAVKGGDKPGHRNAGVVLAGAE